VGRGKVEIQTQDSHFSTAQISLRRKEKNCRLHKTLDAPHEYVGLHRADKAVLRQYLAQMTGLSRLSTLMNSQ